MKWGKETPICSKLESPLARSLCEGGLRGRYRGRAPSLAEWSCLTPGTSSWPVVLSLWLLSLFCGAGAGWVPLRPQAGHYAMLLVEQGVLWVLPMLWLVLLLSEEAGAATATTGSRLLGARV